MLKAEGSYLDVACVQPPLEVRGGCTQANLDAILKIQLTVQNVRIFQCLFLTISLFMGHKANNELLKLDLPAKAKVRLSLLQADLNFIGNDFQRYGGS